MQIDRATFPPVPARALLCALDAPQTVTAVAQELGMSPFQLIRRANALLGATPHQLRIEARAVVPEHRAWPPCPCISPSSLPRACRHRDS